LGVKTSTGERRLHSGASQMKRLGDAFGRCRNLLLSAAAVAAVAAAIVFSMATTTSARTQAQNTAAISPAHSYDVSSIKLYKSLSGDIGFAFTPDGITATNVGLPLLLQLAYGVHSDQILGSPGWIASENYDLQAKVDDSVIEELKKLNPEQLRSARQQMLQSLLADRFKLRVHRETKELPVFSLVISKNGFKLREAKPNETDANGRTGMYISGSSGAMRGQLVSMASLAQFLYRQLNRTVLDKTGLTGKYDFTLKWTPDQNQVQSPPGVQDTLGSAPNGQPEIAASGATGPDLFIAIQEQLGLKLVSGKGPVEVIVIDHIERPSGN
jgi:uncharacterized protein (TIGR03435 family)